MERGWGNRAVAAALYRENLAAYHALGNPEGIADSLTGLVLTAPDPAPERAVRVLGAAVALREEVGTAIYAGLRHAHAASVSAARTALGEEAFEAAWMAGRALPIEAAIAEALAMSEEGVATDGAARPLSVPARGVTDR